MNERTRPFPIEWTAWRALYSDWLADQYDAGRLARSTYKFPPANFLADEVLGVYTVRPGDGTARPVELSEVTFPVLGDPDRRGERARYVGITFGAASGTESGGLAATFAELEQALGFAPTPRARACAACPECGSTTFRAYGTVYVAWDLDYIDPDGTLHGAGQSDYGDNYDVAYIECLGCGAEFDPSELIEGGSDA